MTTRLNGRDSRGMTSQPIRDPLADHLITPENSALVLIDYQPEQIAAVRSCRDANHRNQVMTTRLTVRDRRAGPPPNQREADT